MMPETMEEIMVIFVCSLKLMFLINRVLWIMVMEFIINTRPKVFKIIISLGSAKNLLMEPAEKNNKKYTSMPINRL